MYAIIYTDNTLAHHGILGQRWGHQNGPPYPIGAGGHSASEKKHKWYRSLEKKYTDDQAKRYKSYGLTQKDAEKAAEKRKEVLKKVIIGSTIAVSAAAAVYLYRQHGRAVVDDMIKAGTTIQTLSQDPDRLTKGKAFYTSYRNLDKKMYIGSAFGNEKSKITADITNDIKVAGSKNAKKVFDKMYKENPKFKQLIDKECIIDSAKNFRKKSYTRFNMGVLLDDDKIEAQNMFYDELKKLGYSAVRDINDSKYSGFNTKATIVFDNSKISNISANIIEDDEKMKSMIYYGAKRCADILVHPATVATASYYIGKEAVERVENENLEKLMR